MPYQFATKGQDFTDYAGGRVLYSHPGMPAFPLRLASEILQRARHILGADIPGKNRRLAVFDPTCGGAYHLTALGFLHNEWIESIIASDIDPDALALARRNLGLLSLSGIERRIQEIQTMSVDFGKQSHQDALTSAYFLRERLLQAGREIAVHTFLADTFDSAALARGVSGAHIDLVFSDVPYGNLSDWQTERNEPGNGSPLQRMQSALLPVLAPQTLVAIAADKRQKISCTGFRRVANFGVGKRAITFLFPAF